MKMLLSVIRGVLRRYQCWHNASFWGLSAYRGNLTGDTVLQGFALLNGIDITGKRLEDAIKNGREAPMPTYEDVADLRAQKSLNLDMRERSIRLATEQLQAKQRELQLEITNFDNRKDAFYSKLDELSKGQEDASLMDVRRTLESLPPEQVERPTTEAD